MTDHVLDRPVWSALATCHAQFASGGERARRMWPSIGPLAGTRDDTDDSLGELATLVPDGGSLLLLQAGAIAVPPGLTVVSRAAGVQMVLDRLRDAPIDPAIVPLTADDVPAMVALATATRPGPFASQTHVLGAFFGVKQHGHLLAMAGERLRQPGFCEVSGVCTQPEARRRGLARSLSAHVARQIVARGETPYLHVYAANTTAIDLYRSLGFAIRRELEVVTVAR